VLATLYADRPAVAFRSSTEAVFAAVGRVIARSYSTLQTESALVELRRRYQSLTDREREVMSYVVSGRLNKQVGVELGITEITVKAHRGKVMRKMEASSLAELVMMALVLRLIPAEGRYDC
jgi:FixJ family two-component response regulator